MPPRVLFSFRRYMYFVVTDMRVQLPVNGINYLSQVIMLSAHLRSKVVESLIDVLESLVNILGKINESLGVQKPSFFQRGNTRLGNIRLIYL